MDLVKTQKLPSPGWFFSDIVDRAGPAGDVDGNGYSDFVAVRKNNSNFTFMLFTGRQNGPANTPSWSQSFTGSSFEVQVSTAGDVNGDGFSDVMLSQPYASNGQNFEGLVSVWLGSASGLANGNADWTFECNQADARCGLGLSPLGDINGDGFGDVMIGAPNWDQNGTWICTLSASDINCSKPLVQAGELSSFVLTYATTPGLQTSVNQTADLSADSDDNMTNNAVSEQTILSGLTEMVFQSSFESE